MYKCKSCGQTESETKGDLVRLKMFEIRKISSMPLVPLRDEAIKQLLASGIDPYEKFQIPIITDRIPMHNNQVLIKTNSGCIIGNYSHHYKCWFAGNIAFTDILGWQELPS